MAGAYTVTNLGLLGGGYTEGLALNNNGRVTGRSTMGKTITLKTCCGGCYPGCVLRGIGSHARR